MGHPVLLLVGVLTLVVATTASAAVVEHTFNVIISNTVWNLFQVDVCRKCY